MKMELIASLLHQPKVLFLTNPPSAWTSSPKNRREFIRRYNAEQKTTIVLTSHYMADIQELCERVIIIDHGKIFFDGKPSAKSWTASPISKSSPIHSKKTGDTRENLARYGEVVEKTRAPSNSKVKRDRVIPPANPCSTTSPSATLTSGSPTRRHPPNFAGKGGKEPLNKPERPQTVRATPPSCQPRVARKPGASFAPPPDTAPKNPPHPGGVPDPNHSDCRPGEPSSRLTKQIPPRHFHRQPATLRLKTPSATWTAPAERETATALSEPTSPNFLHRPYALHSGVAAALCPRTPSWRVPS